MTVLEQPNTEHKPINPDDYSFVPLDKPIVIMDKEEVIFWAQTDIIIERCREYESLKMQATWIPIDNNNIPDRDCLVEALLKDGFIEVTIPTEWIMQEINEWHTPGGNNILFWRPIVFPEGFEHKYQ